MIKEDIIKKYKEKLQNYEKHNQLYFNKSKPSISDYEYDKLKIEILDL